MMRQTDIYMPKPCSWLLLFLPLFFLFLGSVRVAEKTSFCLLLPSLSGCPLTLWRMSCSSAKWPRSTIRSASSRTRNCSCSKWVRWGLPCGVRSNSKLLTQVNRYGKTFQWLVGQDFKQVVSNNWRITMASLNLLHCRIHIRIRNWVAIFKSLYFPPV